MRPVLAVGLAAEAAPTRCGSLHGLRHVRDDRDLRRRLERPVGGPSGPVDLSVAGRPIATEAAPTNSRAVIVCACGVPGCRRRGRSGAPQGHPMVACWCGRCWQEGSRLKPLLRTAGRLGGVRRCAARKAPLIRPSATFSPLCGEKDSSGRCALFLLPRMTGSLPFIPSPRMTGRLSLFLLPALRGEGGAKRRMRGDQRGG